MSDVLDGVAQAVRVVVRGVDAPAIAGAVVGHVLDAVGHRVEFPFLQRHLHAQRGLALVELAVLHVLEQLQTLLHRPLPPRRRRRVEALDLVGFLVAHVGLALADQHLGPFVQLLEVVRRVSDVVRLVPCQPSDGNTKF